MRYRLKLATWIVVREPDQPSPKYFTNSEAAGQLALDLAKSQDDDKEHFWTVLLNVKHRYLMHTLISTGSQLQSVVQPREIFGPALREGAVALILIHNHPSGAPEPSREDITLTRQLIECAKLLARVYEIENIIYLTYC